jgi:RimJ/RimL family protein N-acetyltransferase
VDADLDAIYEQRKDPESVRMAAFTPEDPADRHAFLVHMSRVRDDPNAVQRVIEAYGTIAGTIGSFIIDDRTEVTYWIDRALGGRGIASAALQSFLSVTTDRPLFARAAADNAASLRVLEKAGSDASASIAASPAVAERRSRRRSFVSTESTSSIPLLQCR